MDQEPIAQPMGVLIQFAQRKGAASRHREPYPAGEKVEVLLCALRDRRAKLADRLELIDVAIEKLEEQVATKAGFEILSGAVS